jgi:hypothetical protein
MNRPTIKPKRANARRAKSILADYWRLKTGDAFDPLVTDDAVTELLIDLMDLCYYEAIEWRVCIHRAKYGNDSHPDEIVD